MTLKFFQSFFFRVKSTHVRSSYYYNMAEASQNTIEATQNTVEPSQNTAETNRYDKTVTNRQKKLPQISNSAERAKVIGPSRHIIHAGF